MKYIYIFLIVPLLVTGGCSDKSSLSPLSENAVILAFGNSLTHGTGVKREHSYPAVLQKLTGRKVVNAGVPGEVTDTGVKRLPGLLSEHQPALLILIHGGNDMLRKKNLDQAADNLRSMISMAQESGVQVVMMSVPNPTLILSPAEFYEEVADSMGIPIEVDAISDILQYPGNKSDSIHPNEKGYQMMAESLHELLSSRGAL
ncbi:MAG: arylesterase [Gammaproteobacteria bacterium]|nr:arylesterase [Gammaproteobacteria bacterium]